MWDKSYQSFIAILWWHLNGLSNYLYCAIFMVLGMGLGKQLTLIMLDMIIIGRGLKYWGCRWRRCFKLSTPKEKKFKRIATYPKDPSKLTHLWETNVTPQYNYVSIMNIINFSCVTMISYGWELGLAYAHDHMITWWN